MQASNNIKQVVKTNQADTHKTLEIFTDGACSGNPGAGGWGAILRWGEKTKEISGGSADTTNNRMELTAVISALKSITRPVRIILTSDSKYVLDGITKWIYGWKKKNWKNVKNIDLWKELDDVAQGLDIDWKWVKGHNSHIENERCDFLAKEALKKFK